MNMIDRIGTLDMFIDMQLRTIENAGTLSNFFIHPNYPEQYHRVVCSKELVPKCNTANTQEI